MRDIQREVFEILTYCLGVGEISMGSDLIQDLGMDVNVLDETRDRLETVFGVGITDEEMYDWVTAGDVVRTIEEIYASGS